MTCLLQPLPDLPRPTLAEAGTLRTKICGYGLLTGPAFLECLGFLTTWRGRGGSWSLPKPCRNGVYFTASSLTRLEGCSNSGDCDGKWSGEGRPC